MAGLIDADCVVVRLVWIAGSLFGGMSFPTLRSSRAGESGLVIRGSRV
jgi:hypothetical protein